MYRRARVILVLFLSLVAFVWIFFHSRTEKKVGTDVSQTTIFPEISKYEHIFWEGSSDVTVVEFFDIDCPYCRDLLLAQDDLPKIVKSKVKLIYRPFPLVEIYPRSLERAIIAECVYLTNARNNKLYFDFLRAGVRSYQKNTETNDWLVGIGKQFTSDLSALQECISKKVPLEMINKIRAGGYAAGIFSVPSFLVLRKDKPVEKYNLLGPVSGTRLLESIAGQL